MYPSASHFLLVDDVHELHGVIAFHVNHGPLQRILSHLIELQAQVEKKNNTHVLHKIQISNLLNRGLLMKAFFPVKHAYICPDASKAVKDPVTHIIEIKI